MQQLMLLHVIVQGTHLIERNTGIVEERSVFIYIYVYIYTICYLPIASERASTFCDILIQTMHATDLQGEGAELGIVRLELHTRVLHNRNGLRQ